MFIKREIKRYSERYLKLFEPLITLLLLVILTLPILTVINLTPSTKTIDTGSNVLGVSDGVSQIRAIEGTHSYINGGRLIEGEKPLTYTYSTYIQKRSAGAYSKPAFEIVNDSDQKAYYQVNLQGNLNSSSEIGIYYNRVNYVLIDSNKNTYSHTVEVPAKSILPIYFHIKNSADTNFTEQAEIKLIHTAK